MVTTAESDVEAARRQLDRVLSSDGFCRNERLARFLRFVVEQHLQGRDSEIKESVIAVEVFGRSADHDPRRDSIVRTEAGRLRSRLREYQIAEGKNDEVIIELPKGGYTPVFRRAAIEPTAPSASTPKPWFPSGSQLLAALALTAVAAGVVGWWWTPRPAAPISIAVLPLTNLSPDVVKDYFADGLTIEIIRNLSIIEGLAVRSQTSSFAFAGKPRNIREAGKLLGVEYILEGSVMREGRQLRINAQLVRVRDDEPLWSRRFDRELTDVLAIQDEISRGIVNHLRLKIGLGRRRYETSPESYDLYLHARALPLRGGLAGVDESVALYEQVITKDASFAPAFAGLAMARAMRSGRPQFNAAEELAGMRAAAEKAIQLDPLLAEAHDALAMAYARETQWEQSEHSFRRAIELDPRVWSARVDFVVNLLVPLGRLEEALKELRIAKKIDPVEPAVQFLNAWVLIMARRYDEAAGECQKLPAEYAMTTNCLGRARIGQGRLDEAMNILAGSRSPLDQASLGYAYALRGRRDEAEKLAALMPEAFFRALILAGLGDKERVLDQLDRMVPLGPQRMGTVLLYPEFDLIRADARLGGLRQRVGLPE
jgi:serine/threonine-protein kinase